MNRLILLKKPVQRALDSQRQADMHVVREATTGRVVVFSQTGNLPRVWAVAETEAAEVLPTQVSKARPGAPAPEVAFYRKYTEALLRVYLRMSTEAGRVPSLLGRELFRGNVTHCKVRSFEDVVIYCHDMEQMIAKLERLEQGLIKRVALQEYTVVEAAAMLGISLRNSIRLYRKALDRLTWMLLREGMLEIAGHRPKSCQEGGVVEHFASN
jgi:predicted DNA-binding protein (UPF0251 family)